MDATDFGFLDADVAGGDLGRLDSALSDTSVLVAARLADAGADAAVPNTSRGDAAMFEVTGVDTAGLDSTGEAAGARGVVVLGIAEVDSTGVETTELEATGLASAGFDSTARCVAGLDAAEVGAVAVGVAGLSRKGDVAELAFASSGLTTLPPPLIMPAPLPDTPVLIPPACVAADVPSASSDARITVFKQCMKFLSAFSWTQ